MSTIRSTWLVAVALIVAASSQALALNPQPLPPGKLPPGLLLSKLHRSIVVAPAECRGPARIPNPCK